MRPRQPGGEEVVAQRGAHAVHLVGRELFALSAATQHDADVGQLVAHGTADRCTELRVIATLGAVGPEIGHLVTICSEDSDEMLFQFVPGVIGADGDSRHRASL